NEQDFSLNKLDLETQKKILQFAQWKLETLRQWDKDAIFNAMKEIAGGMDIKIKEFLAPLFVAISGSTSSFSVMDAMVLLGSDMSRARLREAVEVLGGAGKKVLARFETEYAAILAPVETQ